MNTFDLAYGLVGGLTYPLWSRRTREGWRERFGHGEMLPTPRRPRIMLHAVSVGEVAALRRLVPRLREYADIVVTSTTDTGFARARALFQSPAQRSEPGVVPVRVERYPLDFSSSVDRFLDRVRPDVVALVELEVWPNFIVRCKRRGIPVGVINGRLSDRSFGGYRRGRVVIGPTFRRLDFAAAQDEAYAQRFRAMGVRPERVTVTGSMKWDAVDMALPTGPTQRSLEIARSLGIDRTKPVIVAGSTAEGEEALLHTACPRGVQLVCAPRKPERFAEAAAAMPGCVRRSVASGGQSGADPASGRFLLDTIGELGDTYRLADVVVLGRSFLSGQGSDPVEPAGMGIPVVFGPRDGNFREAVRLLAVAGGLVRSSPSGLAGALAELASDADRRRVMGERARTCVASQQGASARHADLLLGLARVEPAWASDVAPGRAGDAMSVM